MSETLEPQVPTAAPVQGGVVTYLNLTGAVAAAELYRKAFGAEVAAMIPPDETGRTMHIHLHLNGSSIMMSDVFEEHGPPAAEPQGFSLVIMATDIEAQFQRAVDAGCTPLTPPRKMFWGDTFGSLKDPFGVTWGMNQPG
jgi:uncharacterized glyoxalase superfamily protein PhnB